MHKSKEGMYWFKRRRYGYGWTPVTWQGWGLVVVSLLIIIGGAIFIDSSNNDEVPWVYLAMVLTTVILLVGISFKKGPPPKWRWGKKPDDDPELDI